jgi:hypothetical protein
VAANGWALAAAKAEFRNDPAVVAAACASHGAVLKFASEAVKASRATVLAAVANQGGALQYAAPSLRDGTMKYALRAVLFTPNFSVAYYFLFYKYRKYVFVIM